jgi:pantoate--beta-alanine ligase
VRRMVADLLLPLEIVGVPTVREPDGLALSSRNRFLTAAERGVAPRLFAVLQATAHELTNGVHARRPLGSARSALVQAGFEIDYVALVDAVTLQPLETARPPARLIAAARLGSVRLIDNVAA